MLGFLFSLFIKLEKYTSRISAYFIHQKFAALHNLFFALYGAKSLEKLDARKTCIRLVCVATFLAVIGTCIGIVCFNKIGWVFQEGKPVTILSLILLLSIAYFFEQTWRVRNPASTLNQQDTRNVWWLLSWGFFIAAWDEFLRLHETADRQIHHLFRAKPTHITDHFDDLLVAMYGVIGLWILWIYRAEILLYLKSLYFFIAAAVFGCISVIVDTLGSDKPFLSNFFSDQYSMAQAIDILDITEEFFKISAEICFVGLAISIYKISRQISESDSGIT